MKIEISAKELLDLVEGNIDVTSVKEKLSGAILSIAESPEMQLAIQQRVEKHIEKVIKDSAYVRSKSIFNSGASLEGWAAPMITFAVEGQIKDQVNDFVKANLNNILKSK